MKRFIVSLMIPWLGVVSVVAQTNVIRIGDFEAHPTRILAKFRTTRGVIRGGLSSQELIGKIGSRVAREPQLAPGLVILEESKDGASRVPANDNPESRRTRLLNRIDALKKSGLFEYVEPDYIMHADLAPNDQAFTDGSLWGLLNYGQTGGKSGADIGATNAWELTTGSTNVIVAIIDTGIRYTHKDLARQMWHNPRVGTFPGFTNDVFGINAITGTGDPLDDVGHGTHVAGTIGAAANDGNPSVGVAWHVQLMACKFLGPNGGLTSDAITCIDYAVAKGARILNNSWGGTGYSQALSDAINAAGQKGVLFVAAAGNDGQNNDLSPHYPASYPLGNIISVAALDRNDRLANFSDFGAITVHIGAPGVEIVSCFNGSDTDYAVLDGTSMATPHVSGVAALLLSVYPTARVSELRQRIVLGAVPIPALTGRTTTGARLNAYNALTVSGSGLLQADIDPPSGSSLLTSSTQTLFVALNDLFGVNNGTVTATIPGITNLVFTNNGQPPDLISNDNVYTASFQVPATPTVISMTLIATAPGKLGVTNVVNYNIIPPPPNDMFATATKVPASGGLFLANNRFATIEPKEPVHGGNANAAASLWWAWAPVNNTEVIIDTTGSSIDNLLDVYTNNSLPTLAETASAASNLGQHRPAHVTFIAEAGQVYLISVSSPDTNTVGSIQLRVVPGGHLDVTPPQVFFSSPLSGLSVSDRIITVSGIALDSSPDATGISEVLISVNGNLPTSASGTTNWTAPALLQLGLNTITATALDSAGNFSAPSAIEINYLLQGPANDFFVNAIALTGTSGVSSVNSTNATKEVSEPNHAGVFGGKSVWWTFTAPADGVLNLSTTNSTFDTVMAVYTGNRVDQLSLVASNDDAFAYAPGGFSRLNQAVRSGMTYHIAVDAFNGDGGETKLTWSFESAPLFHVTVNSTAGGSVIPDSFDAVSNSIIVLTAVPDNGYRLDLWTGSAVSASNPLTNIVRSDLTLTATFVPIFLLSDDFETGGLTRLPWFTSGEQPWTVQTNVVYAGQFAASSGAITNNQTSSLFLTNTFREGSGSFFVRVSTQPVWDRLGFYMDGISLQEWSGELPWTNFSFPVAAGTHSLEWRFTRSGTGSGLNAAFIDNVMLPIAIPADATTPAHLALLEGTDGTFYIELLGQVDQVYTLQSSSNLANWDDVSTAIAVDGVARFLAPPGGTSSAWFYRAVVK